MDVLRMDAQEKFYALLLATFGVAGGLIGMHLTVTWGPRDTYMVLAPVGLVLVVALAFYGHMLDNEPDTRTLAERIVDALGFGADGGESFHRAAAAVVLELACKLDGEPESKEDLLQRLDFWKLAHEFGDEDLRGLSASDVCRVRIRCKALSEEASEELFKSSGPASAEE